jgi:hypothetical protein
LLSAAYDAAFDAGLISFADDGRLLLSSELSDAHLERMGIRKTARLSGITTPHMHYLAYHRELYGYESCTAVSV